MRVRCIGKFTIAIGCDTYSGLVKNINDMERQLVKLGIKCKSYLKRRIIITKGVIIKFIFKKHYQYYNRNIYGVLCNGCYGFNEEETLNITNGNNECQGHELLDYISERDVL